MLRHFRYLRPRWVRLILVGWLLPSLLAGPGCTRRFYHEKVDKDVAHLLSTKGDDPRWLLEDYQVVPNDLARFADPSNPDYPPMPPDDPAAKAYSPNPQKPKHGVGLFEGVGYLDLLDKWDQLNRQEQEAKKAQKQDNGSKNDRPEKLDPPKIESNNNVPENLSLPKEEKPKTDNKPKQPQKNDSPARSADELTPEQMQAQAEAEARRELADPVTVSGTVSAEEAQRAASQDRTFLIKLEQAVELGLINSREYQTRRELLYLSALPVTVERFAFTPQFFAALEAARERFGSKSPGGFANRWRFDSLAGFTKLFSTGGLLLASFANQTLWGLAGDPSSSVSQLSLDLIQPLLRGAGKAVTLEPLTQAERNLLYTIRDYARFRQEFYVYIAAGQTAFIPGQQAGVQALSGGTVTAPGIFIPGPTPLNLPTTAPRILPQVIPGDGGQLRPIFFGPAPPQGFLSTLGDKASLINQYRNIQALRRFLRRFEGYLEGGIVNAVQVGQVEQQLLRSVDSALSQQAGYRTSLDQFKLQLGLPMDLRLEVDDEPLEPMFAQTDRFEDISNQFEALSDRAESLYDPTRAAELRDRLRPLLLSSPFVRKTRFPQRLRKSWQEWEKLKGSPDLLPGRNELEDRLDKLARERDALRRRRDELKERNGDLPKKDRAKLEELEFEVELGAFERALRVYARRPWLLEEERLRKLEKERDGLMKKKEADLTGQELQRLTQLNIEIDVASRRLVTLPLNLFQVVLRQFLSLLEAPRSERLESARKQWPNLPQLCVEDVDLLREDEDTVVAAVSRAALENRLDLMNQRAQLVDSWRKIRVVANSLLGTFNVTYSVDAFTPAGELRPFQFGGSRTQHRLIFNTELPLVRIQERNAYRAALIAFQRQRRDLQQAEDQVLASVRLDLRQLRSTANSYHKVQKRSVELAYQQVDQALQAFSQPQSPTGPSAPPGSVGPPPAGGGTGDPAANTQQLLQAQNALLQAQNGLYNTWLSYLSTRMNLYRDMGLMPLDPRGVWLDESANCCSRPAETGHLPHDSQPPAHLQPAAPGDHDTSRTGAPAAGGGSGRGNDRAVETLGEWRSARPHPAPGEVRTVTVDDHGTRHAGGGRKQ